MNFLNTIPMAVRLAILFVVGASAASLVNLGIYRLAWHKRPIQPLVARAAGRPPRRLRDLLPIFGWLGLRREAALHGRHFWVRPMLLELLTGAGFALLYWWEVGTAGLLPAVVRVPPLPPGMILRATPLVVFHYQVAAHLVLICFMLLASWIDLDENLIPDSVTVTGTLAALLMAALWPISLLPDVIVTELQLPLLDCVWLSTPLECMPWSNPAWTGWRALALGLGCFWAWCLALLPWHWYTRHGVRRAWQIMTAHLVRDWTTYAILAMGLLGSAGIAYVWHGGGLPWAGLLSSLAGMAVGGGLIWIVRVLGSAAMGEEAMGFGDVTLLAMIGAFLGWQAAVIVFFLAPFAALVRAVVQLLLRGKKAIPYGPFLCLAALTTIVAWAAIWERTQDVFLLGWWMLLILVGCLSLIVVLLPPVRWLLSLVRR